MTFKPVLITAAWKAFKPFQKPFEFKMTELEVQTYFYVLDDYFISNWIWNISAVQ